MQVMHEIPRELADAGLVALVLPFGEWVSAFHEDAPLRYGWGDVPLPRRELPLREEHDGRQVGLLSSFVVDRTTGIWARVKAGRTATALIAKGVTAISAELDDGKLTGAALVTGTPAFASARLYGSAAADLQEPQAPPRFGLDPATGMIAFRPPPQPSPTACLRPAMDLGAHRRELHALSMQAVHGEVAYRRREFERRREALAEQDVLDEQMRLVAEGRPVALWPGHLPMRKQYDEMVARREREEIAEDGEIAAADFAERMARLEAAARAARPWYRRWWK